MSTVEEIQPFLVCRAVAGQLECALWTLESGQRALTLFLSEESATAYLAAAQLAEPWRAFRPGREALVTILKECHATGVSYAVLDPDAASAKRLFDLKQVIDNAGEPE